MHIFLGSDHRGFELKKQLILWLNNRQVTFTDCGATEYTPDDDYNDYAKQVAQALLSSEDPESYGVLFCGSAQGMAMQANRYNGIRAAVCYNSIVAAEARSHNDANIACIPASDPNISATDILTTFLSTPALPDEKYQRRNHKLDE